MSTTLAQEDPHFHERLANELEIWVRTEQFLFADFLSSRGYDHELLQKWVSEHERAQRAYKNAIQHEETTIVKKALNGDFDASFARFYLINRHDYSNHNNDDSQGIKGPVTLLINRPERKSKKKVK